VSYEATVFRRISKLYNNSDAEAIRRADVSFLEKNKPSGAEYLSSVESNLPILKSVIAGLGKYAPNDPFGLSAAYTETETLAKNKKIKELTFAHLSLLNSIDVFLTSLQLERGNSADFLQTVYVQKDVAGLLRAKGIDAGRSLLSETDKFIELVERRKLSVRDYPDHVEDVLSELKKSIEKLPNSAALMKSLNLMKQKQEQNDIPGLQKEHMNFLLSLRAAVKNLK
jgi:hypothetical protein